MPPPSKNGQRGEPLSAAYCEKLERAAEKDVIGTGVAVGATVAVVGVLGTIAAVVALGSALAPQHTDDEGDSDDSSGSSSVAGAIGATVLFGGLLVTPIIIGASAASAVSGHSKADKCRELLAAKERIHEELGLVPAPGGWKVTKPSPLLDRLPPRALTVTAPSPTTTTPATTPAPQTRAPQTPAPLPAPQAPAPQTPAPSPPAGRR